MLRDVYMYMYIYLPYFFTLVVFKEDRNAKPCTEVYYKQTYIVRIKNVNSVAQKLFKYNGILIRLDLEMIRKKYRKSVCIFSRHNNI